MRVSTEKVTGKNKHRNIRNQAKSLQAFKQHNEKKCLLCSQRSEEDLLLCRACAKKYGK